MRTLRSQLVLSHILPFLLVLPLITIALLYLVETQVLLANLSQRATERATLIGEAIQRQVEVLGSPAEAQAFVADLTVSLDGRVLLLTPDGRLLAAGGQGSDSATQPLQPAGITTAIQGQQSVLVTYGLTEQTAEVLVPITDGTGKVVGIVGVIQTLSGLESLVNRMRMFVLATLVVELILGTVIGLLLARRLARPITVAASAVVDLSEGRAVTPMVEQGPREIRQLSTGVNILSERLRLLEETRRRSLANIVHELGRPLGAMRSAVHVLRGPVGDDPAIRDELLGGVEGQIERMQPLLDDLAQLHGQGQGVVVLERELTRLDDWLPPILLPWRAASWDASRGEGCPGNHRRPAGWPCAGIVEERAVDRGDAHLVAVILDTGNDAAGDAPRMQHARRQRLEGQVLRAKAEHVRIGNRPRADPDHIPHYAAHARVGPAKRLQCRRMVVGFDLKSQVVLIVELHNARVVYKCRTHPRLIDLLRSRADVGL